MNNKLTDEKIKARINAIEGRRSASRDFWDGDYEYPEDIELLALLELQERRKAAKPELNPANLVNKFYERYPLASFRDDGFRAAALGYFMAGAELQCFGEFVKYEELCGDE
ncbi:hypothetical protein D5835_20370 [Salmonella enterica subsp. enterica serovar Aba]|nr:hypothetical protein [Salmonella enterica subsp. enterica serovar Aba]EBY6828017.1 hypothetical protein [Salmonella enterica subsp. enterica serovar Aba]